MARTATAPMDGLSLDRLGDATTVLVLADRDGDCHGHTCESLLAAGPAAPTDLLRVTYHGSPGRVVDRWAGREDTRPADARVVAVGEAAARAGGDGPVQTVGSPADLTSVGIAATRTLSEWEGDGHRTVACFDSVTDVLSHVEFGTAYEFLHVLSRRLEAFGALSHFHLDPAAHEDRTVARLKGLFDAVVADAPGGRVEVRTR